jgi:hypothetical protein
MPEINIFGILVDVLALVIAVAMMLAQFRLFSIDRTLKQLLVEMKKGTPPGAPATPEESEGELARRRGAIAEVQSNWLTRKK